MRSKGFFILGTDTNIGKTHLAVSLLSVLNTQRYSTIGLKPIASGGYYTDEGLRNADAVYLQKAASVCLPYSQINPFCFADPIAPHIAAERENSQLSVSTVVKACYAALSHPIDYFIIEGVGGICVPLNARETFVDLVQAMGFPVIFVVGLRLGCLNQALLSWHYLRQCRIHVVGWLANQIDPEMEFVKENVEFLKRSFPFPYLGFFPYLKQLGVSVFASLIDYETLIKSV